MWRFGPGHIHPMYSKPKRNVENESIETNKIDLSVCNSKLTVFHWIHIKVNKVVT